MTSYKYSKKAFSLIEILVSLILLSCILAAFVPVITKKLDSSDISVTGALGADPAEYIIPLSQEDCPTYSVYVAGRTDGKEGGVCVTKWNLGDNKESGHPDFALLDGQKIKYNENEYTLKYVDYSNKSTCSGNTSTTEPFEENSLCCWGVNENPTSYITTIGSGYPGGSRTVCTYQAAVALCSAWKSSGMQKGDWELPTKELTDLWTISQLNAGGPEGIQMCAISEEIADARCSEASSCPNAADESNYCYPSNAWTKTLKTATSANIYSYDNLYSNNYSNVDDGLSVRCIAKKVPKNVQARETAKVYKKKEVKKTLATTNSLESQTLTVPESVISMKISDMYSAGGDGAIAKYIDEATVTGAPSSQEVCDYFGGARGTQFIDNTCVTRTNVGDDAYGGPETPLYYLIQDNVIPESLSFGYVPFSYAAWKNSDYTAASSTCSALTSYSGCKRALVGWAAAYGACGEYAPVGTKTGDWSLPTKTQLEAWSDNYSILGASGLDLCQGAPYDMPGISRCESISACNGSQYGCQPSSIWSATQGSNGYYAVEVGGSVGSAIEYNWENAKSARCVLNSVATIPTEKHLGGGGASGQHKADVEIPFSKLRDSRDGSTVEINRNYSGFGDGKTYSVVLVKENYGSQELVWGFRIPKGENGKTDETVAAGKSINACEKYDASTYSWIATSCSSAGNSGTAGKKCEGSVKIKGLELKNCIIDSEFGKGGDFSASDKGGAGYSVDNTSGNNGTGFASGGGGASCASSVTDCKAGKGGIGYVGIEYTVLE